MKATDDPRIIASQPAPGAGVGLRSARPFGLPAFPGGAATIGRVGQAALRFAQRSLAAPLRYQQTELTWLDSFRLGRRPPAHIQPWRRRPAAPAPHIQLSEPAPEIFGGVDDWAAEMPPSPMPFIQPPAAPPSLARLARAITAGSPALSLRRSAIPAASQSPGQPAEGGTAEVQPWQPAGDHSLARSLLATRTAHPGLARSSAGPGGADAGQAPDLSGSPLALIQPLRAGRPERADPRSAIARSIQRPGRPADPTPPVRPSRQDTPATQERADPRSTIARSALPADRAAGPPAEWGGHPDAQANAAATPQPAERPAGPSPRQAEAEQRAWSGSASPILLPGPAGSGPAAQRTPQAQLPLLERYHSPRGIGLGAAGAAERPLVAGATSTLARRMLSGVAADSADSPGAASISARPLPGPEQAASSAYAQTASTLPGVISRAWAGALLGQPLAASADPGAAPATRASATWLQPLRALPALMRSEQGQPAISRSGWPAGGSAPAGESGAGGWGEGPGGGLMQRSPASDQSDRGRQPLGALTFSPDAHPSMTWGGAAGQTATPAAVGDAVPISLGRIARSAATPHVGLALILRRPLEAWQAAATGSADATNAARGQSGFISRLAGSWLAGNEPAHQRTGPGSASAGRQSGSALPLIAALQRSTSGATMTAPFQAQRTNQPARAAASLDATIAAEMPPAESDVRSGWISQAAEAGEWADPGRHLAQRTPLPLVARRPLAGPSAGAGPGLLRRIDSASALAARTGQPQASDVAPLGWLAPIGQPGGPRQSGAWLSRSSEQSQATAGPLPETDFAAAASPRQTEESPALSGADSEQAARSSGPAATSWLARESLASGQPTPPAVQGQRRALDAGPLLARSIVSRQDALRLPNAAQRFAQRAFDAVGTPTESAGRPGLTASAWLTPLQRRWSGGRTGAASAAESGPGRTGRPESAGPSGMPWPLGIHMNLPASVQAISRSSAGPGGMATLPLLRTASVPAQPDQALRPDGAATAGAFQAAGQPSGVPASAEHGSIWRAAQTPWPAEQPAQAATAAWDVPLDLIAGLGYQRPLAPSAARPTISLDRQPGQERRPLGVVDSLPLIQPARLAGEIWQRAAAGPGARTAPLNQAESGNLADQMTLPWSTTGRASPEPLSFIQPARLAAERWHAPSTISNSTSASPAAVMAPSLRATPDQPSAAPLSFIQPARLGRDADPAAARAPWSAGRASAAPLSFIQPARLGVAGWQRETAEQRESTWPSDRPAASDPAATTAPWSTADRASAAPLSFIQPARLGVAGWQRETAEQRESTWPSDRPAANDRAATTAPWADGRASAAPLSFIQPARLIGDGWQQTLGDVAAPPDQHSASDRAAATAPWSAGRASAAPLNFIQPARLIGQLGQRATAGMRATTAHHAFARPDLLQRTADRAAPEIERGSGLELMEPLARPLPTAAAPGESAQTLASSLIHRFSADGREAGRGADSPASASALELLRPNGLEHEQHGGSEGGARSAHPAAQAPSLDLLQPMREASPPALQRALDGAENGAQGGEAAAAEGGAPAADIEALARQVYARLRRRLKIDAERLGN